MSEEKENRFKPRLGITEPRYPRDERRADPIFPRLRFAASVPVSAVVADAAGLLDAFALCEDDERGATGPLTWGYSILVPPKEFAEGEGLPEGTTGSIPVGSSVVLVVASPWGEQMRWGYKQYETAILVANVLAAFRDVLDDPQYICSNAQQAEDRAHIPLADFLVEIEGATTSANDSPLAPEPDDASADGEAALALAGALALLYFGLRRRYPGWTYLPGQEAAAVEEPA